MKIAIIGSKGQLGSELKKALNKHETIPIDHDIIEVSDRNSCNIIQEKKPDIVINTAAYHKTDACEDNPKKAFSVNAIGAKNIAEICKQNNATSVYISTDYVFDGTKNTPYTETDIPNPVNTYGISKLAGEQYTKLAEKHYIIRTSSLFGTNPPRGKGSNFVDAIIKKAQEEKEIKVVEDIITSPTYAKDAAGMIKAILENQLPYGTYHITNSGYCSWYQFAKSIIETTNLNTNIKATKAEKNTTGAKRPIFSALKSTNLKRHNLKMRNWKDALNDYLKEKNQKKTP